MDHFKVSQVSKSLFSWGCKKDYRVFKPETETIHGICQIDSFSQIKIVCCGTHHSLFVTSEGQVYGWGKNTENQIVPSKNSFISIPRKVGLEKIVSVAAGWGHSLALSEKGSVYSWGFGEDGQLGHGNQNNSAIPTEIYHSKAIKNVYAGHSNSGFIDIDADFYSFGFNKDYRCMIERSK